MKIRKKKVVCLFFSFYNFLYLNIYILVLVKYSVTSHWIVNIIEVPCELYIK